MDMEERLKQPIVVIAVDLLELLDASKHLRGTDFYRRLDDAVVAAVEAGIPAQLPESR